MCVSVIKAIRGKSVILVRYIIATCNDIKCIHGWCVNPNVCECKPGYYTDDLTSVVHCNYSNCKETYGLLCIECTQEECKKCIRGYYLKESQCSKI